MPAAVTWKPESTPVGQNFDTGTQIPLYTNERPVKNCWQAGCYPPNSPFWLKGGKNQPTVGQGENTNVNGTIGRNDEALNFLIDFTQKTFRIWDIDLGGSRRPKIATVSADQEITNP